MYLRVSLLLCILNVIVLAKSQEGYEPEFIIIQPPAPSPPADYNPHAESTLKPKEEPKRSTPPAKTEPPKSESSEAEPAAPKSAEKPEAPAPPPPRPHPKAIPQKVEARKEPKSAEASSSPQADEPKAPPQNFKHDDCLSDTIFVIDSTSSVRNLFEQHRIYASNVINEMNISPETNHVGVVLYSSKQRQSIKISLSDPQNKENISAKINSLPYLSGITATGAALHLTLKDLEHRRLNAMTNVVVISDGFSYDLVDEPVKQLQQLSNVRIFAVSLGESYRKYEMLLIASHEENFLTGADSYKELVRRLHQCNEGLRKGNKSDETKGDSQGQIVSATTQKNIITSSAATTKSPKKEVINEVKSVEKNVVKSSSKSSESSESSEEKESAATTTTTTKRPKPVTEKPKSKPVETKKTPKDSSEKPKKKKIEAVSSEEKKSVEIAKPEVSLPKKDSNSGSGNDKKDVVKNKDCRYDIVFVIDASGSLRKRYQHQLEIASKLIDKFDFEKTQIGVIRYSGRKRSKVAISLGSKKTKEGFNKEFLQMPFMGGTTYTDEALDKAFEEITGPNVRADALPMVIVFTDGFSQPDPAESAKKIHAKSIPTFAIGITDGQIVNENELRSIASTPKNVFLDSNINELEQLFVQLSENC